MRCLLITLFIVVLNILGFHSSFTGILCFHAVPVLAVNSQWRPLLLLVLSNDVESNPGPKFQTKKSKRSAEFFAQFTKPKTANDNKNNSNSVSSTSIDKYPASDPAVHASKCPLNSQTYDTSDEASSRVIDSLWGNRSDINGNHSRAKPQPGILSSADNTELKTCSISSPALPNNNPDCKKRDARRKYELKHRVKRLHAMRTAYASNPDKQRIAIRAQRAADPEKRRTAERAHYAADPEKKRTAERAQYAADPEKKRTAERAHYAADPEKKRTAKRAHYAADPTKKKAYESNLRKVKQIIKSKEQKTKSKRNPAAIKRMAQERSRDQMHKNIGKLAEFLRSLPKSQRPNKSKVSNYSLSEYIIRMLDATHSAQLKKSYHHFYSCQDRVLKLISAAKTAKDTRFRLFRLTGNQKHRTTQMPFDCSETIDNESSVPIDESGQGITNSTYTEYPILSSSGEPNCLAYSSSTVGQWDCSYRTCGWGNNDYTEEVSAKLLQAFERIVECGTNDIHSLVDQMNQCSARTCPERKGHPSSCYECQEDNTFRNISGCDSFFLTLRRIQLHFPTIRTIVRQLYKMKIHHNRALSLKSIIESNPKAWFEEYQVMLKTGEVKLNPSSHTTRKGPSTNSAVIMNMYRDCKDAFNKRMLDLPVQGCLSCKTFQRKSKCNDIFNCNKLKILNSDIYVKLLRDNGIELDTKKAGLYFVCHPCHAKLKKNVMPPLCYLNRMEVAQTSSKISSLHEWEKLLIPRAHAFQAIYIPRTVSGARKPSNQCHRKARGLTLHLPIPIEETLENVLKDEEVFRTSHLHIGVRTGVNKKNIIFQDVVNINKVYEALKCLKYEYKNYLYEKVNIPTTIEEFRANIVGNQVQIFELDSETDLEISSMADCAPGEVNTSSPASSSRAKSMLDLLGDDELKESENCTIMPLNNERQPTAASSLYKLGKVEADPLRAHEVTDLDLRCYPDLFPDGKCGENDPNRQIPVRPSDFAKAKMRSVDPKFRQHRSYKFYLHNKRVLRELSSGIYSAINIQNFDKNLTAAEARQKIERGDLDKPISTVFSKVRGTQEHLKVPRMNLSTMIRNYGPAHWFLTFSPTEWQWPGLKDFLQQVNENFRNKKMTISQMTSADPHNTAIYVNTRFKAFLAFLQTAPYPIGKIKHYFFRREYQGRGMVHFHCLFWIKDGPIIGVNSDEEVSDFIQKYVTCQLPDTNDPLFKLVDENQRHYCNSYCTRTYTGKVQKTKYCRFKFPRDECLNFILNDVAKSIAARRTPKKMRLYDLCRDKNETNINDYNPACLEETGGNMDLQFIGEESCTACDYTCKYATKAETTNIEDSFKKSARSTHSTLWSLAVAGLKSRDVGDIEVGESIEGYPITETDPDTYIKYVNTAYNKNRFLKPMNKMMADESSKEIFFTDNVEDRYPNRPDKLENMSLMEFMQKYDHANPEDVKKRSDLISLGGNFGYMKPRKTLALISHPIPKKDVRPEEYYECLLMLFTSWRNRKEVLGIHNKTYEEAFRKECTSNDALKKYEKSICSFYGNREIMDEKIKKAEEKIDEEIVPEHVHFSEDLIENIAQEFSDGRSVRGPPYEDFTKSFNSDQSRIFSNIISSLHAQNPDISVPGNVSLSPITDQTKSVFMFISGYGGTGKSFLIKGLTSYVQQVFNADVALMAPTGIAASNINGMTMHRLLQLPVQHGKVPPYASLSDQNLHQIHQLFKNVKLFITDEISMVNNVNIVYVHRRLGEIFNQSSNLMGGQNFVCLGDLLQLSPIMHGPCFKDLGLAERKLINGVFDVNLWHGITYDELTNNVRQQNDPRFAKLLLDVRVGFIEEEDERWLLGKCAFKFTQVKEEDRRKEIAKFIHSEMIENRNYTILVPTNSTATKLNQAMLEILPAKVYSFIAIDQLFGNKPNFDENLKKRVAKLDSDPRQTAGLESVLHIKIGCKVMLRRNLDVSKGLCNGSIGIVKSLKAKAGSVISMRNIEAIEVEFEKCTANIKRVNSEFFLPGYRQNLRIRREQFPLILSYAMTVHKSQGLTLNYAMVDCGNEVFGKGQIYVALSRVTCSDNLKLLNFNSSRIRACEDAKHEYTRLGSTQSMPPSIVSSSSKKRKCREKQINYASKVRITDVEENVGSNLTDPRVTIGTFKNPENVTCYANATIQCILNVVPCQNLSGLGELGCILKGYTKCEAQSLEKLRNEVGYGFQLPRPQDPGDFLFSLLQTAPYDSLKPLFELESKDTYTCTNTRCDVGIIREVLSPTVSYQVTATSINRNVQELLEMSFRDIIIEDQNQLCKICHSKTKSTAGISRTGKILIIKINPVTDNNEVKKPTLVKQITSSVLKIGSDKFKFKCMVSHCGDLVETLGLAHYIAWIKLNASWFTISDEHIKKQDKWPSSGYEFDGKKSPYLLFYIKTD